MVAPPSIRKGRQYTWVAEPNGALLEVPTFLVPERTATWGCGDQDEVEHVPPGSMYDHLGDLATRCACAGMHRAVIERVLLAEFEAVREPGAGYGDPVRGRRDTERLAEWAAGSDIAQREREHGGDLVGLVAMWGAHGLRRRRR